jgi:hypothetical protein
VDVLEQVIHSLSTEEYRKLQHPGARNHSDDEKRLMHLLQLIHEANQPIQEDEIQDRIYHDPSLQSRDKLNKLRKRLLEFISENLLDQHQRQSENNSPHQDLGLSFLFKGRGKLQLSLFFLMRAEKKALQTASLSLLEQIHEAYLQLAFQLPELELDTIQRDREANLRNIEEKSKVVRSAAKTMQTLAWNRSGKLSEPESRKLQKALKKIGKSPTLFRSMEDQILAFQLKCAWTLQTEGHAAVAKFVAEELETRTEEEASAQQQHLFLLTKRAWNLKALLGLREHQSLLEETETMALEMRMFGRQHYHEFLFPYYHAKSAALLGLGRFEEAEACLKEAIAEPTIEEHLPEKLYFHLDLAQLHFRNNQPLLALQCVGFARACNGFSRLPLHVLLGCDVLEAVCRLVTSDHGAVNPALKSIHKKYRELLRSPEHSSTSRLLVVLADLNLAIEEGKEDSVPTYIEQQSTFFENQILPAGQLLEPSLVLSRLSNQTKGQGL